MTDEARLKKYPQIAKSLSKGMTVRDAIDLHNHSQRTVMKIRKALIRMGVLRSWKRDEKK